MKNKKVLVVGGSRGLGFAIVKKFELLGAKVYYISRNKIDEGKKIKSTHIYADLNLVSSIQNAFDILDTYHKNIDILVNVAGINYTNKHEKITSKEFESVININLKALFLTCKLSIRRMLPNSKIVNVSSIAGRHRSIVSGVHYTSSKAGIIGLTRQLAYEIGPRNININCICPSQFDSDMLRDSMTEQDINRLTKTIPLRRLANIEEIVDPVIFLCSNESNYIHGACIDINGGQL